MINNINNNNDNYNTNNDKWNTLKENIKWLSKTKLAIGTIVGVWYAKIVSSLSEVHILARKDTSTQIYLVLYKQQHLGALWKQKRLYHTGRVLLSVVCNSNPKSKSKRFAWMLCSQSGLADNESLGQLKAALPKQLPFSLD